MIFQRVYRLHNRLRLFFFSVLFIALGVQQSQAQDWKLVKDSEGIKVYTRTTDAMDYKAFKSIATIDAELSSFVALIKDVKALKDWGYKLKSSSLLKRQGDTVQIYFAEAKAPFPYKNRYGIYLNEFTWNNNQKELYVSIDLLENYDYHEEDLVMLKGKGYWRVTQLENSKLEVVFEMQVDPGKGVPAWLSNLFADESPYETMRSVKEEIIKPQYQNKQFDFLSN